MNFAYIQARKGSKRFPGKNKTLFDGKPMITHTIDIAKKAWIFDYICVATDDEEIAEIARRKGIAVFWRAEAGDEQTDDELAREIVPQFKEYDIGCRLYSCTPLLPSNRLVEAMHLIIYKYDAVRAVAEFEHPPERALKINDENRLTPVSQKIGYRTQDLRPQYYDPGAFLMFRVCAFDGSLLMANTAPVILNWWEYQDIDYPGDLRKAEAKWAIG